ncbi:nineteen complex-related protein 2-domain-containing protein [Aspergillus coremiiformis]|uniref:Nineteen complex-related protein 2-domain-containing protein n=1 Tax=Aspergillus coremiiformis TaxID=138285 RepID=A0A5N6YW70_9EURO|nr:nineteen complex-related protein 2-domain-containing protein [Aspergillus coremiiformis]
MSAKFANRRKPRKIGGDDEEDDGEQDIGPLVKRPVAPKTKQKSKMRLSFGPGETSMADDGEQESEVVIPKRQGLGRRALENSAFQRSLTPSGSGNQLPLRVGLEQDRPNYSSEYLKELRDSTPSTPKNSTDDDKEKAIDVAAKFGEVMKVTAPAVIPSEAEIREKKERRARLAKEQQYGSSTENDFIALDDTMDNDERDLRNEKEDLRDTRLIRDDEDFAEGFDEFVEDGRISLGKKAERERAKKQREEMRELIEDAEGVSDEDDSDLEEKAAYEAAQTRAAMGHSGKDYTDRPKTPPKMTSLPRLSTCLDRLRTALAVMEKSKAQMLDRMEELRKEKADIAVREVEIQALIKEAGDNYEKLKQEAGRTPGSEDDAAGERGLESFGNSMARDSIPFIETPIDSSDGTRLHRHFDATPIELFFDLFFVANLSTFTATHEIHNVEVLGAYIGFLGVIWFTWLQVTLFDIRFARDSIFERTCKAIQLAAMVGFASAGTRFTTRVRDENVWAFQSLSLFLSGSRILLALQYTVNNVVYIRKRMKSSAKGVSIIAVTLFVSSLIYLGMFYTFGEQSGIRSYIWTVWFALFGLEMWIIMGVSCVTPGIGLQDTHLNVRMGLLTLIIIGEGVISVTRIVNRTVRPGGWTKWSFVHILGVTTNVYFLWQAYYDLSPRGILGKYSQQVWAQLHFPFHVALVLLLEGSQILALTLDITLKLTYLEETIMFACEEPRPRPGTAIRLLRNTIEDMEINYSRGAVKEKMAIDTILEDLPNHPLCPGEQVIGFSITNDRLNDLVGNVTAALFSSMGIMPSEETNIGQLTSSQLLRMYMELLGFVYIYFFIVASLVMFLFAAFAMLTRRHTSYASIGIVSRIVLGLFLASLVSFVRRFALAYDFMTSPTILYAFAFVLLTVFGIDRLLDLYENHVESRGNLTDAGKRSHPDTS